MNTFVHLIADYGKSDPAFSEVVHRLKAADPDVDVQTTAVPPFSTVATGFWIEQLGLHNPAFEGVVVYSNTAPRTETATSGRAVDGGDLCFLTLETGVPVVAVDAGHNLSFVRDRVDEFRTIETPATTAQFRSRDYFPNRVIELANGERGSLGSSRSVDDLPPTPEAVVCHVDGYGNIKTSIRASEFDLNRDEVTVEIGGESTVVAVREAVPAIEDRGVAMVPGSAGGDDPYMELFLRGGSATAAFERPDPGDDITIR